MLQILNPTQEPVAPESGRAPRLASLAGQVVGLYDNGKLNARRLLEMVAQELAGDAAFTVRNGHYRPDGLMQDGEWQDVDDCDVIILANGDCGACSSSGLANAIALEKRGVPAFLISTPPFTSALQTMAKLQGMTDIEWGIVEHPIGSVEEPDLRARAKAAAAQFRDMMLAAPPIADTTGRVARAG